MRIIIHEFLAFVTRTTTEGLSVSILSQADLKVRMSKGFLNLSHPTNAHLLPCVVELVGLEPEDWGGQFRCMALWQRLARYRHAN